MKPTIFEPNELAGINLKDYNYSLPEERIAQYPLEQRDESKLLVYSNHHIDHQKFKDLSRYLPAHTTLVFNDTKVIPARLYFQKSTGAIIEVFLLNPVKPSPDINIAMQAKRTSTWSCMIGNLKRWKRNQSLEMNLTLEGKSVTLTANRLTDNLVVFNWNTVNVTFVDLIKNAGQVPLPPYLKRPAEFEDKQRYQTVYSKVHGAVAAPTAGLHFTNDLLKSLASQGITREYLTLHVGAGTFQPIKTNKVTEHPMHGEQIKVTARNIENLLKAESLVAVGTTSLRTLESLYWFGVQLLNNLGEGFNIAKLAAYETYQVNPDFKESLGAVKAWMSTNRMDELSGYTEIFIFPPYQIKSCSGLITNFHLPSSTLILLVAAFIGQHWQEVYQQAIDHGYRFLSYGDSSLLLPPNAN